MIKPEPIELENNLGPDAVTGEINRVPWMAYDVDEMDQYIAAKDAEIQRLKHAISNGDVHCMGWIDERDMPAMEPRVGTRYFLIDVRHLTWRFFFRKVV